jgi:hypothetical protein
VGVLVLPQEIAVSFVADKFAGDGEEMVDERMKGVLEALGASLVEILKKTRANIDLAPEATA